mgnify:FL=1
MALILMKSLPREKDQQKSKVVNGMDEKSFLKENPDLINKIAACKSTNEAENIIKERLSLQRAQKLNKEDISSVSGGGNLESFMLGVVALAGLLAFKKNKDFAINKQEELDFLKKNLPKQKNASKKEANKMVEIFDDYKKTGTLQVYNKGRKGEEDEFQG